MRTPWSARPRKPLAPRITTRPDLPGGAFRNGSNAVPTYDGWRASTKGGKFDPNVDSFLQPVSYFGAQPTTGFGNETRFNPKLRSWPGFNENFSLARSITLKEQTRLDFRWETFNVTNSVSFDPQALKGANLDSRGTFGKYSGTLSSPRVMQFGLRYEF